MDKKQKVVDYDSYDNPYIATFIEKELDEGYFIIGVSSQFYYAYSPQTGGSEKFTVTTVIYEKKGELYYEKTKH